ncbi:hypothetical protein O7599_29685 [Streptomyces sp. WMMC500]|uniref:glycosyl hydrolase family 95 catalytic domain-containing protein n=1 Tax=Streptomyces sp. WMMC500 TaxID=3015154 RepID=UPI00248AC7BD|nr:hypothetical protein [Streptomyces sp. WMMC500]WBB59689.1 hypothetical protein O7599_29685 [Streptomyces sp. WMMC500]
MSVATAVALACTALPVLTVPAPAAPAASAGSVSAVASSATADEAWRIVQQYTGTWTSPPSRLTGGGAVDAPLLGNGDVGVAIGGEISQQTLYLGKNDFFSGQSHAIRPLGRIVFDAPGLAGASYRTEQDIAEAEVRGTYTLGDQTLTTTSWVDANRGMVVTSFTLNGGGAQTIDIRLQDGAGRTPGVSTTGHTLNADVAADTGTGSDPRARIAARTVGQSQQLTGNTIRLTLSPGGTSTLVAGVVSSIDSGSWREDATAAVANLDEQDIAGHLESHRNWWRDFWSKSYVEIPDKAVEKGWYGSLYLLACAAREGKYAPGLWGNWITGPMNWNGDYHTNYNYQAPFYAGMSSNRVGQLEPYDQPVLDWQSRAEQLAAEHGFTGVLYPVGLSPKGTSADLNLHNQKSNAANLASVMVMRFQYTRDAAYAAKVYPWLKQVGRFWQDYLVWDEAGNRYVITNDAPHEGQPYPQTNSGMSLGLVNLLFRGLVDISATLGQDSELRDTWQHILTHLSDLPTMTLDGKRVLRETEVGSDFHNDGNDIVAQPIFPGNMIGLDSDPDRIQTARNTIDALTNAWHGGNAPATFYAAAARVGYDPAKILANLHEEATGQSYPNMAVHHNGGGMENVNVLTSGVNEMLLQSFQNDVKVFPTWPTGTDGKFGDLLAYGNFLVSSSKESGSVQYVQAVSRSGREFTFTNPWPGSVQVFRNGADEGTVSGAKITIPTSAGDTLQLAPAGTPLSKIRSQLVE